MRKLNLLPPDLRPQPRGQALSRFATRSPAIVAGVVGAVVLVAAGAWQASAAWRYRAATAQLRKELAQLKMAGTQRTEQQQTVAIQRAELLAQRERIKAKLELLAQARQPAVPMSQVLADVAQVLPEAVWVTRMNVADDTLKITGAAREPQLVATLITAMEASGRFRDTTFAYTQRLPQEKEQGFAFEVSAILPLATGE